MAVALTTTEAAAIDTETYSGEVIAAYKINDIFASRGMKYFSARPTEVINQPIVSGTGIGTHLDDGGDHTTRDDAGFDGVQIPLYNPIKAARTIKKSSTDIRPDLNLVREYGQQHGITVGYGKTVRLINALAKDADNASNSESCDSTDAVAIRKAVEALMADMDAVMVSAGPRYGCMAPAQWYKLNSQDGVIRKDWGGMANAQTFGGNGAMINYANCEIKNIGGVFGQDWSGSLASAASLPSAFSKDLRQIIGVFWQGDAWALREQVVPTPTVGWVEHLQCWLTLSRHHMGYKAIQTKGIWVLKKT